MKRFKKIKTGKGFATVSRHTQTRIARTKFLIETAVEWDYTTKVPVYRVYISHIDYVFKLEILDLPVSMYETEEEFLDFLNLYYNEEGIREECNRYMAIVKKVQG